MRTFTTPVETLAQGRELIELMRMLSLKICHELGSTDLANESVNGAALALHFVTTVQKTPTIMADLDNILLSAKCIEDILFKYYYAKFIKYVITKYNLKQGKPIAYHFEHENQTIH